MRESEADFQRWVTDLLATYGWKLLHEDAPFRCHKCQAYQKPRKIAGHPDIEAVRGNRLIYLELKSAKGTASPEQREAIEALQQVTEVHAGVYRPKDREFLCKLPR